MVGKNISKKCVTAVTKTQLFSHSPYTPAKKPSSTLIKIQAVAKKKVLSIFQRKQNIQSHVTRIPTSKSTMRLIKLARELPTIINKVCTRIDPPHANRSFFSRSLVVLKIVHRFHPVPFESRRARGSFFFLNSHLP